MRDAGRGWHERVALRGVELLVRVGSRAHEREAPQPVVVDVELRRRRGPFDEAASGYLDYDRVYRHLVDVLPARPHVDLLERLADDLVAFCLEDPRVEACRVAVSKPAVYGGRAVPSVEVYRSREG